MKNVSSLCTILALAVMLGGIDSASAARHNYFGVQRHVDDLANDVQQRANIVCWELFNNYRHKSEYGTVYREAKEMWAIAGFIHDLAHNRSMSDRIKRNVAELDKLFHHLEDDFADWGVDVDDIHGHRHDHGRGYQLARKMARLEDALHHLRDKMSVRP